jgi:hypothetical protein
MSFLQFIELNGQDLAMVVLAVLVVLPSLSTWTH